MRAVADDAVQERLALDALAHQPALHVGDGDHDGVDPAVANHRLQLGQAGVLVGVTGVVVAHRVGPLGVGGGWKAGRCGRPSSRRVAAWTRQAAASSPAARSNSRSISVSSASVPCAGDP